MDTKRSRGVANGEALRSLLNRGVSGLIPVLLIATASLTQAQVGVSASGAPTYSIPIPVPPGIAGLQPQLELSYTASGVNGPQGYNWGLQGLSMITRCPATKAVDGRLGGSVRYTNTDQLCLDGERLIRINAGGGIAVSGFGLSDALGLTNGFYEYRTERDSYARIRAYGAAHSTDISQGPAFFKVWTKAGQIYEYGAAPSADANTSALITAQGKTVPMAWAVGRISDLRGNYIDFKYEQRDQPWGTGTVANTPEPGREWNIREIQYTGNASQAPTNKIVFVYSDRLASTGSEAYHMGSKTVSVRQLDEIRSYINSPNAGSLGPAGAAVLVRTQALSYQPSAVTPRLLLQKVTECTDLARTRCMPPTKFSYTTPARDAWHYSGNTVSDAFTTILASADHKYGVQVGDFDGDTKTDLLRWSDTPNQNKLYLSSGSFNANPNFNISDQNLSKSDGCYKSYVADFNGDGLSDILRWHNNICSPDENYLYLSTGSGAFAKHVITGVDLKRKKGGTYVIPGAQGGSTSIGYSERANFYLLDVNDDGLIDVVQHQASAGEEVGTVSVFRGDGKGDFVSIDANIQDLYSEPVQDEPLNGNGHLADIDGDGLMDIVGVGLSGHGAWRSVGNGRFQAFDNYNECKVQIDFNGDGRTDCLVASDTLSHLQYSDGNVGYKRVPNSAAVSAYGDAFGFAVTDLNGDGCSDLIRWTESRVGNAFYYSNCNGLLTKSSEFSVFSSPVAMSNYQFKHTNGANDFLVGDFFGRGSADILLLQMANASASSPNSFLVKADATPPDLLLTVVNSLGRKTSLVYVPLSNSSSGTVGLRYASDRGTSFAAVAPKIDLVGPRYVVATVTTDTGVNDGANPTISTEYAYRGLKADYQGRGELGFREVRRQQRAPDGSLLTTVTRHLQDHPYIGLVSRAETRVGGISAIGADQTGALLETTVNSYCDITSQAAPASAQETAPCPVVAKIQAPYLALSVVSRSDLNGTPLPIHTVTWGYDNNGNLVRLTEAVTAVIANNQHQNASKTTINSYQADDTGGDNWIRGRLIRSTVSSSVPNSLPSVTTSSGRSAKATATNGN